MDQRLFYLKIKFHLSVDDIDLDFIHEIISYKT